MRWARDYEWDLPADTYNLNLSAVYYLLFGWIDECTRRRIAPGQVRIYRRTARRAAGGRFSVLRDHITTGERRETYREFVTAQATARLGPSDWLRLRVPNPTGVRSAFLTGPNWHGVRCLSPAAVAAQTIYRRELVDNPRQH